MEEDIQLSATQTSALHDICVAGKSGFLTGAGGTGKSFLVKEICQTFQSKGRKFALTATTGIAAVLIGGVTLHSFFRIFPDDLQGDSGRNLKRVSQNKFFKKQLKDVQTLIIDEVSMLDCELFERVHEILCHVHGNGSPFGGIQVLLVGDFFQLPPVTKGKALRFLFECALFWETCDEMWDLKEVWRQTDAMFCQLLQRVRVGTHTEQDLEVLKGRLEADLALQDIEPTKLFSRNVNVDALNVAKLNKLSGEKHVFESRQGSHRLQQEHATETIEKAWETWHLKFQNDVNMPEKLELKIGTQVMLAFNMDTSMGLCNGSRGVVVGFSESKDQKFTEKSFHKIFSDSSLAAGEGKLGYLSECALPVVKFENGSKLRVPFVRWTRKVELGELYIWQIPLRHAWATTIHRMQGQTLNIVDISLDSSVFEVGQAYVALSRARTLQGIRLSGFDPACIKANEKVCDFYLKPFALQKAEKFVKSDFEI